MVVGVLFCAAASDVSAQISDIHTRWGPSGTHMSLPAGTQTFNYEATITNSTTPYQIKLEVYHNGVLKFTDIDVVAVAGAYSYSQSVAMTNWGLSGGDLVTFVCKVIDPATGATLATHFLYGDVVGT